ncbi:hypothetical protein NWE61_04085 [Mycoplasmopsis felis]|uniref:hypothetical protein n=1 Tax=Mycoplasmopsis felis TaxID=33923 RepID=UPI0021E0F3BF|nr:hypothetical protein [Mycoplasmopsis felis]MCU9934306.1 hypothetical protein [Mycoplasmopsis felis]
MIITENLRNLKNIWGMLITPNWLNNLSSKGKPKGCSLFVNKSPNQYPNLMTGLNL